MKMEKIKPIPKYIVERSANGMPFVIPSPTAIRAFTPISPRMTVSSSKLRWLSVIVIRTGTINRLLSTVFILTVASSRICALRTLAVTASVGTPKD